LYKIKNKTIYLLFQRQTNIIYYVSKTKLCHNHENPVITPKIIAIAAMEIMENI